jgi:glutamyl-tRNA synthetase
VRKIFEEHSLVIGDENKLEKIIGLVKERCTLLTDFWQQANFFFVAPTEIDTVSVLPKWNENKNQFFVELIRTYSLLNSWDVADIEHAFKELATASGLKPGELMLPFRIMLVGGKFGPGVFDIAAVIGKEETIKRIDHALSLLKQA